MEVFSWDTETELFRPALMAPPVACLSYKFEGEVGLLGFKDAVPFLRKKLQDPNVLHVGHHIAYDMCCMAAEDPSLLPLIFKAYAENRVTDTMLRMQLLDNAVGKFNGYWKTYRDKKTQKFTDKWVSIRYNLADCTYRATKKKLEKDKWRMTYGEFRDLPIHTWPAGARAYPKNDARATDDVYFWQKKKYLPEVVKAYGDIRRSHISNPQPLRDEFAQARAALWIQLMSVWGIKTDPARVDLVEAVINDLYADLEEGLKAAKLIRSEDHSGGKKGSRDKAKAQERMVAVMRGKDNCSLTASGQVSLGAQACRDSCDPILIEYSEYKSLEQGISDSLAASGLIRLETTPASKKDTRNIAAAKQRMIAVMGGEDKCKKTDKNKISLDEDACKESGDPILIDYAELGSPDSLHASSSKEI